MANCPRAMAPSPSRSLIGVLSLLLLAAAAPASADGATENPPPLFTRIGVDLDGAVGPGSCESANPSTCAQDVLGLDLLSLEVREAYAANGTGQALFLVGIQGGEGKDNTLTLHVKGGADLALVMTSKAGGAFNSTLCDATVGPYAFPGADDHVKAVECRVSYAKLGLNGTGAKVTGIRAESAVGTSKYDVLPGTWYSKDRQDTPVPYVPVCEVDPSSPGAPHCGPTQHPGTTPFEYALKGPAKLLDASLSAASVDLAQGPGLVQVQLTSLAANLTQEVALALAAPSTVQATLDAPTAVLVSNTSATVALSVVGATRDDTVTITLTSDLGAYQVLTVDVKAPRSSTCPPVAGNATRVPGCPGTSETSTTAAAPGFELMPMAALLGLATFSRRRRE